MNPWIGLGLIAIGVAADVILTLAHQPAPSILTSIIVAGLGIVQAVSHARARSAAPPSSKPSSPPQSP